MKTAVKLATLDKIRDISAKRKKEGRSDWSSEHILSPLVDKQHKKECNDE